MVKVFCDICGSEVKHDIDCIKQLSGNKEPPKLTPDSVKQLGQAFGTLARLFNEGYAKGLANGGKQE